MERKKNKKIMQSIVLAGGQGTRMKSSLPKPMVGILGQPILSYILDTIVDFSSQVEVEQKIGVVVGHKKEMITDFLSTRQEAYEVAWQQEQKGTAHALECFLKAYPKAWESDYMAIFCGDTPLLEVEDLKEMFHELVESDARGICASFITNSPKGMGRIIKGEQGFKIIEEKDASEEEKLIKEVNSGFYILKTSYVKKFLGEIKAENKASEFYLTDLFDFNRQVVAKTFSRPEHFLGINDLSQLAFAEGLLQEKKIKKLQAQGVRFLKPETQYIEWGVKIGQGSLIYPHSIFQGESEVGENCMIEAGVTLKNTKIKKGSQVFAHSYLEEAQIGEDCLIGPFARIRPGSYFESQVKVGNFVETKKTTLKKGAKVSHLSYVGDAEIGEDTNIGCGFITCNYDGVNKHQTVIGAGSFIGSDCQMIAPVKIGDHCFVAAGSTITHDMENEDFAIARSKQITKKKIAKKFLKVKK